MKIYLKNNDETYAILDMVRLYIPEEKIEFVYDKPLEEDFISVSVDKKDDMHFYETKISYFKKSASYSFVKNEYSKFNIKLCLLKMLDDFFMMHPPWGILTGIRPSKNVIEMIKEGKTFEKAKNILKDEYFVDEKKANLAINVAKSENEILKDFDKNKISLYIGIPFCPSRCLYCSFISQSIGFSSRLVKPYLNALYKEIEETAHLIKGKEIETVYIGGGTPTTLSADELKELIKKLYSTFDLSKIKEFTVEAGRPDTITKEKLEVLKDLSVTRISINPQTMNDKTLKLIGRNHTADDIIEKFNLAREVGFNHINMDLIVGLPGETTKDFEYTLSEIEKLNPESITVHSLSVKRGSYLDEKYSKGEITKNEHANKMIDLAVERMEKMGKIPYYMYRQKNTAGNLENVGFCSVGHECLYNIYIMQEIQSIISLGAGGSTKIVTDKSIERVFNVKEVSEYINRIDEMIERKRKLIGMI